MKHVCDQKGYQQRCQRIGGQTQNRGDSLVYLTLKGAPKMKHKLPTSWPANFSYLIRSTFASPTPPTNHIKTLAEPERSSTRAQLPWAGPPALTLILSQLNHLLILCDAVTC